MGRKLKVIDVTTSEQLSEPNVVDKIEVSFNDLDAPHQPTPVKPVVEAPAPEPTSEPTPE